MVDRKREVGADDARTRDVVTVIVEGRDSAEQDVDNHADTPGRQTHQSGRATGGRTDGRATDGRTDGHISQDGWADIQTGGRTDGRMDGGTNGRAAGRTYRRTYMT